MTNSNLRRAVRRALQFGIATAMGASSFAASAQTPATIPTDRQSATELTEVVVTGSRVKRPEYDGNIPGVQTTSEQIELRGFNSAIEILQDIPLVGLGANNAGNNGGQPSSLGASFVDLLDLGTQRTLTLVNGRRYVSGNAGSLFVFGNETGNQVDVNTIPTALIERIDVLTVGGAVAYGSDAIAGVVNYVMKQNFEGIETAVRGGQTTRGDGGDYAGRITWGTNFADGRGNVYAHGEFNRIEGIQANERDFRINQPTGVTNFANGSRRNPAFTPGVIDVAGQNNGAFLRAADDAIPGVDYLAATTAANVWPGGVVFNVNAAGGALPAAGITGQVGPFGRTFTAGNTQLIPGVPGACNPVGQTPPPPTQFCTYAPTALPTGTTAASVLAAFGVSAGTLTAAQQTTLAINLLQSARPTPREYFGTNPTTSINAFLGTFVPAFPDVANPIPGQSAYLPRVAVPLRFNNAGELETYNVATLNPNTPSTIGGAFGGDGFNPIFNTVLRVEQKRSIANFGGHLDLTDNVTLYTENSYSKIESISRRNGASANTAASGTEENAALIIDVNNPYLTAANRATLAAAGIPSGFFVLSRTNQDIMGDNPFEANGDTLRSVLGAKGQFELLSRQVDWDVSATYGRSEGSVRTNNIKDVEFALALDTATDSGGRIVCRSQLNPAAFIGTTPVGVSTNLIRQPGAGGIPTEQLFAPRITAEQISACQPLNPFGFNRMTQAAKNYVVARQEYENEATQTAVQATVSFPVVTLPGGDLATGIFGEFRSDEIDFDVDPLSAAGRTRTAAIARTQGETETVEYGAEIVIPIFGDDFSFPGVHAFDVGGGVRRTQQDGEAPTYRNLAGQLVTQSTEGDPETIWSVNLNWTPIEGIRIRGEMTRAIRQPNVVELFLGGQPAFNTPVDPCGTTNISGGPNPALRRQNCELAVVAAGIAPDRATAATFLQTFVAQANALQGTFSGSPTLKPESAESWTAGIVLAPTIVPGLQLSSDLINIELEDIIFPTTQTQALNFCFDSGFPDNSAQFGVNTCALTRRLGAGDPNQFQLTNGFQLGFLNLAARHVRAVNSTVEYKFSIEDLFDLAGNIGNLSLYVNHYHLLAYRDSASGTFVGDTQKSHGSINNPRNEVNARVRYSRDGLTLQWTTNWFAESKIFTGGAPANIDNFAIVDMPAYHTHDFSASYQLTDQVLARLAMTNVFDKNTIGDQGFLNNNYVDQIGRRFAVTLTAKF